MWLEKNITVHWYVIALHSILSLKARCSPKNKAKVGWFYSNSRGLIFAIKKDSSEAAKAVHLPPLFTDENKRKLVPVAVS